MKMRPFGHLLPAVQARRRLLAGVHPIRRTEEVPLTQGLGRIAARLYRAPRAVPAFSRASWDGYALSAASTRGSGPAAPIRFKVVGEVFAEEALERPLGRWEAAAVATGAAIPDGADAVAIFEDVEESPGEIVVRHPVSPGARIARAGEDYPKGAGVVEAGEWLSPAALGGLAAIGHSDVRVYARPRVAIVPNGNELLAPGEPPQPRRIYESNNLTLAAVVHAAGGNADPQPPVPDDPRRIARAIRAVLGRSDLVLVTGGSSVGEHDFLPSIFPSLGKMHFHGIAVRPGKPTLAVQVGPKLIIGMPGHPTSCLANGFWLLLPVLRKLARLPGPGWSNGWARLTDRVEAPTAGLSTVVPLAVRGDWATPTFHHSSAITSLSGANAFALLPPGAVHLSRGRRIRIHLLNPPLAIPPVPFLR